MITAKVNSMLAKIKFVFLYWLMWILIFEFSRFLFLIYNFQDTRHFTSAVLLQVFIYGLRMDASMASYISIVVCIFLSAGIFIQWFTGIFFYKIYTGIILLPVLIIIFCDLPVYNAWGNRLDASALKYLAYPKEMWASVSNLPVFRIIIFFTLCYFLLYKFFSRLIKKYSGLIKDRHNKTVQFILLLLFIGIQIIPLRGGIQQSPLNQSSVYFSKDNFINLAAVNVPWNFMSSLYNNTESSKNPFAYLDKSEATSVKDSLLIQQGETEKIIDLIKKPSPNIIIVVWESFTEKATHAVKDGHIVTPGFNELKKEGVYFSNIYATGDRTDKGIVAVLSGYPAQPITSIIKIPEKAAKLPTLPGLYLDRKYNTSFYYGGELEFANMKSYLLGSGFQNFTSKDDFAKKDQNSKWGAHDQVVKNKILADLSKKQVPFFATWLTLSSHEPYETPVSTVIHGDDDESLFLNSIHYSDSIVYDFVQQCKQQPWWNNTLMVIVADHGHLLPRTEKDIDKFKIPLLWLGGALTKSGIEINTTGSQIDIPATLIAQTGMLQNPFVWSKDLLKKAIKEWAYFSFNNGFGFVQPGRFFIFDNVGKMIIEERGNNSVNDIKRGKAIQQESFQDYLDK